MTYNKPVHTFHLEYSYKQGKKEIDYNYMYLSVDNKPAYALTLAQAKELIHVLNVGIKELS